ncbi:MAG: lytic transglycosylase domain-containing protein [Steroidobacteraceae bacterium]
MRSRAASIWSFRQTNRAVLQTESVGCAVVNGKSISSSAGALGLMQLMPATWAEYQSQLRLGDDPYDARNNIMTGAA